MTKSEIASRLDEATRRYRLLDHPFYRAWAEGSLTTDDLAFYSTQYWRQVESFPEYLEALADRLPPSGARDVVRANLSDEREGDHASLWLDFARAMGVDEDQVRASAPEIETQACIETFRIGSRWASPAFALGMLYGYESQTPEVARTKTEGLRRHYGVGGSGLGYFELHADLDVEHTSELADALEEVAGDDADLADAARGAEAGARAIYGLLDGVARMRCISAA